VLDVKVGGSIAGCDDSDQRGFESFRVGRILGDEAHRSWLEVVVVALIGPLGYGTGKRTLN